MTAPVRRDTVETALPPAYGAFSDLLKALSVPLRQVLCGQLLQFEQLTTAFAPQDLSEVGEFEGLGGLTLRGDISQIVQSELLLRTEAPLEFLRRLAESETLFHEKQYADPGARSVYRAMVSVGPGSLGHGRMVALAALIFMARVAQARGAEFAWCFLPRSEGAVWFDSLNVNTVKRLLRAASYREMTTADAVEALAGWTDGRAPKTGSEASELVDWVIAAKPRRSAVRTPGQSRLAVDVSANALAFDIAPPSRHQPRSAVLLLRQHDSERSRTEVKFPDDRVCVSALKSPFQPFAPKLLPAPPPSRREPVGWEPRFFMSGPGGLKAVRLRGGLLILSFEGAEAPSSWFVPLPADVQLAGIKLDKAICAILLHSARQGRGFLSYGVYNLAAGSSLRPLYPRICPVSAEHLFRKQDPHAIPTLQLSPGVRFYSTAGQAYEIELGPIKETPSFKALYREPKILWSNGVFHVVRHEREGRLEVLRLGASRVDSFMEGDTPVLLEKLLGMTYAHAEHRLAYSVSPGTWVVAARGPDSPPQPDLRLQSCETLLSVRVTPTASSARIWSDARRGGDGTVRIVKQSADTTTVRQPVLKLGEEALSVVKVEVADEGLVWAMLVDDSGEPSHLRQYRPARRGAPPKVESIDLAEQVEQATVLDLEPLHG